MSLEISEEKAGLRVVHEGERQRRHARYRIAAAAWNGVREFSVQNWSLDGLCLGDLEETFDLKDDGRIELAFNFDEMQVRVRLRARVIWRRDDLNSSGLQFVDLTERELSTLRYVIDAFLAGDVISTGDLIHIVGRENFGAARSVPGEKQAPPDPTRRLVKTGLLAIVLIGLLSFSTWLLHRRIYSVEASWAAIEAPIVVVRAPQASYFRPVDLVDGQVFGEGDNVALVELLGGGAIAIDSPCRCSVVEVHARSRDFVAQGEPLLSLLPEGDPVYIRARVSWTDLRSITLGDRAEIRLGSGEVIEGRVMELASGSPQAVRLSAPLKNEVTVEEGLADLLILPTRPLSVSKIDEPVWVTVWTGSAT